MDCWVFAFEVYRRPNKINGLVWQVQITRNPLRMQNRSTRRERR
jgi:hypothetical protein